MNPSKKSGTSQESKIRDAINDYVGASICERVAQHGNRDHGDLRIDLGELVLTGESKYSKTYPTDAEFRKFMDQTVTENDNAMQDGGLLFVNLPNKSFDRMEVWLQLCTLYRLRMRMVGLNEDDIPPYMRGKYDRLMSEGESSWCMIRMRRFLDEYVGHFARPKGIPYEEEGTEDRD